MSVRMRDVLARSFDELRFEPSNRRVRATVDGAPLLDSTRARLVWEPRRVVPQYAVPREDVSAAVEEASTDAVADHPGVRLPEVTDRPVLDPRVPFGVHSTPGRPVTLRPEGSARAVAGFEPDDEALAGYVVVDFRGPDRWLEEDEEIFSHPRDPFHDIAIRRTSRRVQVSLDGVLLADTRRAVMLFETLLPPRYYIPADDIVVGLEPSSRVTACPYKGVATYRSPVVDGRVVEDLAWCYEKPLDACAAVAGHLAFFDEKVDVVLDGVPVARPVTPWS
jgi:uncharacterized protein (DUF427 family)